jgi:hypothetical protein
MCLACSSSVLGSVGGWVFGVGRAVVGRNGSAAAIRPLALNYWPLVAFLSCLLPSLSCAARTSVRALPLAQVARTGFRAPSRALACLRHLERRWRQYVFLSAHRSSGPGRARRSYIHALRPATSGCMNSPGCASRPRASQHGPRDHRLSPHRASEPPWLSPRAVRAALREKTHLRTRQPR